MIKNSHIPIISLCLLFAIYSMVSCNHQIEKIDPNQKFTEELKELSDYFSIPGLSAMVCKNDQIIYEHYFGNASLDPIQQVDSATAFPVASITKLFSAVLAMRLVESGKLSLDTPVNEYIQGRHFDQKVQVKHLLSHTSQGTIGKEFFYSSRFSLMTRILESASGKSFDRLMQDEIIEPLNLSSTFLLKDSLQLKNSGVHLASPNFHPDSDQKGFIDYGYSASAGIVSTARELMIFNRALNSEALIKNATKSILYNGLGNKDLPYSYGIFKQQINGLDVFWVYGQYDCYSSLTIKVPDKKLDLVLLANNNLMSDPARLIMGDLQSSLFASSFLKNYVFNDPEMKILETDNLEYAQRPDDFYRKKVLAQALAASFLSRYDSQKIPACKNSIAQTFEFHTDILSYADINLLHTLIFLKEVHFYKDLGEFKDFDEQIEQIGKHLLAASPNDPYLHTYMGTFYDRNGQLDLAASHFSAILSLQNFSPNWYTREAENWIKDHPNNKPIKNDE